MRADSTIPAQGSRRCLITLTVCGLSFYGLAGAAPLALRAVAVRTGLPFRRVGGLVSGPVVGRLIGAPGALTPAVDQAPAPKRSARTAGT